MPELEVYITSRDEDFTRSMFQYSDLQVTVPLNGARECRFTCPLQDTNSIGQSNTQHFIPMRRFVKVIYRNHMIFHGPIVKPIFNFAENTVEVNCHDPSIWIKHHYIHTGDDILDNGGVWDVNSDFLVELLLAAQVNPAEYAAGYATLPIYDNNVNDYDAVRTITVKKGSNVWDLWMEIVEGIDGPDFRLKPIHEYGGTPIDGLWCAQLDVFEPGQLGSDLTDVVDFHFGFARTNLSNFIHEPDGNNIINRFTAEKSNGKSIQVAKYNDGIEHDGIMEVWEQMPEGNSTEGMAAWAEGHVKAYGLAPATFTIEPMWDMGLMGSAASTPWRFPSGFQEGDRVRGITRRRNVEFALEGRVTKVTLNQMNAVENVATQIELIPDSVDVSGITVGDDASP